MCQHSLNKFGDEEIREIYKLIIGEVFTLEKSAYQSAVENAVNKYVNEQGMEKLKKLWSEKTKSDSPREWSKKHRTPILCLVDDKDIQAAKNAFATINRKQSDSASVEKAIEFIEKADFFDKLFDSEAIDSAFRTVIVKSYSVILDDLDEVRSHSQSVIPEDVYDWYGLPTVDKKLRDMAEYKYNQTGCYKALEKIEDMDVSEVKQYLKKLIRDSLDVGMEIIKGK